MAVVVESVTQTLVGTNDSTPTFNMPSTRPDNDLYLMVNAQDGADLTYWGNLAGGGWTGITQTAISGITGVAAYRVGSSEPASYTITGASEQYVFHVVRCSGYDTSTPTSTVTPAFGTSTAAATPVISDPNHTGGLLFHSWAIDTDNPTYSSGPSGCTFRGASSSAGGGANTAYGGLATDDTLTTDNVATSARTMPGTYDDDWVGIAVVVRVAAGASYTDAEGAAWESQGMLRQPMTPRTLVVAY